MNEAHDFTGQGSLDLITLMDWLSGQIAKGEATDEERAERDAIRAELARRA